MPRTAGSPAAPPPPPRRRRLPRPGSGPAGAGPSDGRVPDLAIARDGRVPVRRQIAAQLAAALRAGRWRPGERLPGTRDLADRLGVHRETVAAAYRALARRGLVEVRPGSGAFAAPYRLDPALVGRALRGYLARERAAGTSAGEVAGLLGRWREALADRRVAVVARDSDLLAVWTEEVREALAPAEAAVEGLALADARSAPDRLAAGLVLAGPAARAEAEALAPAWTEVVSLRPGVPPAIRRLIARVPAGAVLAAVSRSRRVRDELRDLAAGLRGGEVAVAAAPPGDRERLRRRVEVARFVLVDVTCRETVAGLVADARRRVVRHLAGAELEAVARWLGAPPG